MTLIALRSAAARLEKAVRGPRAGVRFDRLLAALNFGQLKAGFHAPIPIDQWIGVSANYWQSVTIKDMQSLRVDRGQSFDAPLSAFSDQCLEILRSQFASDRAAGLDNVLPQLSQFVALASKRYEVWIREADFAEYLDTMDLTESASRSNAGAPQKNWREIAFLMAAYLLKYHQVEVTSPRDAEAAATAIFEAAKKRGTNLPKRRTIQDLIPEVYKAMSEFNFRI